MPPPYQNLPKNPGCYLFKDSKGSIIYIGKAKNLKKRVAQYFQRTLQTPKTQALLQNIVDIDYYVTDNEVEAILLENRLIKKHKPKFNIELKESKRYAYIKLTDEQFPRLVTARQITKKGKFFGPYTQGQSRQEILNLARKLFKIRTCKILPKKVCLLYHIKRCSGPCENHIAKEDYQKEVQKAVQLLKGDTKDLLKKLKNEMEEHSEKTQYERAKEIRDQIRAIEHISEKQKVDLQKRFDQDVIAIVSYNTIVLIQVFNIKKGVILAKDQYKLENQDDLLESFIKLYYAQKPIPKEIIIRESPEEKEAIEKYLLHLAGHSVLITIPKIGEKKRLLELVEKNARLNIAPENRILLELQERLSIPRLPMIIECFDISNLGSDTIVGAMTQFIDAKPNKKAYRVFNIKTKKTQDDFRALNEIVFRRYKRQKEEGQTLPDLVIIDGGPVQLEFAQKALRELSLNIPIIAIAKKEEEIYLPQLKNPIRLSHVEEPLKLVQKIRDATHSLVINFHRKKRRKTFKSSELDNIQLIGEQTKHRIFEHFKNIDKVKKASTKELLQIMTKSQAKKIKEYFKKNTKEGGEKEAKPRHPM